MLCKNCSRPLESEDKFCPECGTRAEPEAVASNEASNGQVNTDAAETAKTDETVKVVCEPASETADAPKTEAPEPKAPPMAEPLAEPETQVQAEPNDVQPPQYSEPHYTGAQYIPPVTVNGGAQPPHVRQQPAGGEPHYTGAQYIPPVTVNGGAQHTQQPPYMPPMYITNPTIPVTFGQWLGMLFLMAIPFVNLVLLLVWSFSSKTNLSKQNFARAYLVYGAIIFAIVFVFYILLAVILIAAGVTLGGDFFSQFTYA